MLALAVSSAGSVAVLDDLAARRCAAATGVRVVGTIGIVVQAQRLGLIHGARPVIDERRDAGMWITDDVVTRVLQRAGIE